MPVVGWHEELAAMLRVVIPVRAWCVSPDFLRTVRADSGCERRRFDTLAYPGHGDRHLNEVAAVDRTRARCVLVHRTVNRAGPRCVEPHGSQSHPALTTRSGLVFDHVCVRGHRTDVREPRQAISFPNRPLRPPHTAPATAPHNHTA